MPRSVQPNDDIELIMLQSGIAPDGVSPDVEDIDALDDGARDALKALDERIQGHKEIADEFELAIKKINSDGKLSSAGKKIERAKAGEKALAALDFKEGTAEIHQQAAIQTVEARRDPIPRLPSLPKPGEESQEKSVFEKNAIEAKQSVLENSPLYAALLTSEIQHVRAMELEGRDSYFRKAVESRDPLGIQVAQFVNDRPTVDGVAFTQEVFDAGIDELRRAYNGPAVRGAEVLSNAAQCYGNLATNLKALVRKRAGLREVTPGTSISISDGEGGEVERPVA